MAFLHRTSLLHDAHTDVARVRLVVVLRRRQHAALATHSQRWAARPHLGAAGRGLEFRAEVPRRGCGSPSGPRYAQRPLNSSRPTGMSSFPFPRHGGAASLEDKAQLPQPGSVHGLLIASLYTPLKGNGPIDGPRNQFCSRTSTAWSKNGTRANSIRGEDSLGGVVVVGWERCGSLNLKHADMFALVRLPAGINIDPRAATGLLH